VGDGVSTVDELVAAANKKKPERVRDIVLSEVHLQQIARQGYTRTSVLPKGISLPLVHWRGRLFGGRTREMPNEIHPILRAQIEKAARITKQPTIGFDLIIKDPTFDPDTQEWGIVEANTLPFIDLHYWPLYGEPTNVAAAVWDLWK
jgi:D-alanine-D-alanine ligase-like ATP-grasp enzyme